MPETKKRDESDVQQLKRMLREGIEHHRPLMRSIYMNLAFLEGYQWVRQQSTTGAIEPIKHKKILESENMLKEIFLWRQGYMFKNRPVPTLHAGGVDIQDMEAANVGSKLADFWYFVCGQENAEIKAWQWMQVAGVAWIAPAFVVNPNVKTKRTRLELEEAPFEVLDSTTGQRSTSFLRQVEDEVAEGEIKFHVYTPLNTYCYPLHAADWEHVEQVIHADIVSKEWIEEHLDRAEKSSGRTFTPFSRPSLTCRTWRW